jgi:Kef-type K+ transport system membrane component KefB
MPTMSVTELFLIAMLIIFTIPYLLWRIFKMQYYAPLVVIQIVAGILLGPGVLGAVLPDYYRFIFHPQVVQALNGIAWWAVMVFVWVAGIELGLKEAWANRVETSITAGLALGMPFLFGCFVAAGMLMYAGWLGVNATTWQFVAGIGMACAVTALPVLILLMESLEILRHPLGQRVLRYASLDDITIWGVLALILLDWTRVGRQVGFFVVFAVISYFFRKLMVWLEEKDRWYFGLIWLTCCAWFADFAGLHYMVGAFLAGTVMDSHWFNQRHMDLMRYHVTLTIMPVYFLSTGLRTNWSMGGQTVFIAAGALLVASVAGKLLGVSIAGKMLKWQQGEASVIGWLLQTKALIMIIFANILLDKELITSDSFTALLLMAVVSTILTIPVVHPKLQSLKSIVE